MGGLTLTSLWIAIIILVASFFQASAGFGLSLLSVPLMALVVAPETAVVVSFFVGVVTNSMTTTARRAAIHWDEVRALSSSAIVMMPIGVLILVTFSAGVLRLLLGVVTCAAAAWIMSRRGRLSAPSTQRRWHAYFAGGVSGVLNTALSTNGPPLVIYLRARSLDQAGFRSTISTVLLISNVGGLAMLLAAGAVHRDAILLAVMAAPALLLGWLLGNKWATNLHTERFTLLVDLLLLAGGIAAITKTAIGAWG
jgi:uncharacterized membrane protein YfcA